MKRLLQHVTKMTWLVLASRAGRLLAPYVFHPHDTIRTGAHLVLAVLARVDDTDNSGRLLAADWMPEADPGRPLVEVEDLLAVHALSPIGRPAMAGGVDLVPAVCN